MGIKSTRLLASLIALAATATLTTEASAYLHPSTGRFISRDPGAGSNANTPAKTTHFPPRDPTGSNQYADGMNLYEYVRSEPTINLDPTGTTVVITCKARNKIKADLKDFAVTGYDPPKRQGLLDIYTGKNVQFKKDSSYSEIAGEMIRSKRVFKIKGSTSSEAVKNWKLHIDARRNTIIAAKSKIFGFKTGRISIPKNTRFWSQYKLPSGKGYGTSVKGGDTFSSIADIWDKKNGPKYSMACQAGAGITMLRGIAEAMKRTPFNAEAARNPQLQMPFTDLGQNVLIHADGETKKGKKIGQGRVLPDDWVPGDWGAVKNTKRSGRPGREAENVIYLGNNRWWGHTEKKIVTKPLGINITDKGSWLEYVWNWNKGAKVDNWRKYPKLGLHD
jgi:hypothetical protein